MATPPPVRRRRAKTPPNYDRSKSEYHEKAPPPLPPRDMYSGTVTSLPPRMSTADLGYDVPRAPAVPSSAPPVPSTPRPNLTALQRSPIRTASPPTGGRGRVYPSESETFSLSNLVTKHSDLFPIKVRVTKGFFGERGEDSVIPVDEMYNLYFVKKAKVVTISDSTKCKYIVPINSASKFGLIYQSPTIRSENHVFETIEDILVSVPLPKVVFARLAHQGNDESTSVHKNEVLIIKGIHKPGRLKTMFRSSHEQLKVFSLKTMKDKLLSKDVFGRFTVDPQYTQLYLPELIRYVEEPIPSPARLFLDYDSGDPLPDFLVSGVIQLEKIDTEISIIASQFCDFENENEHQFSDEGANLTERMVDIPVTLDIEVSVIPPQEACDEGDYEYYKLYDDAMNLVKDFDPHTLSRFDTSAEYSYVAQTRFFSAVRKGYEKEGLDIVFPSMRVKSPVSDSGSSDYVGPDDDYEVCSFPASNVTESLPSSGTANSFLNRYINSRQKSADQPPAPPRSPRKSVTDLPPPLPPSRSREPNAASMPNSSIHSPGLNTSPKELAPPPPPSSRSASQRKIPPIPGSQSQTSLRSLSNDSSVELSSQLGDLQRTVNGITGRVGKLEGDSREISGLRKDVSELQPLVHSLQSMCENLQVEVGSMRKEMEELRMEMKRLVNQGGGYQTEEVISLEQLNQEQVLQLLENINLQKYKAIFETKAIDGITLSQYTEDNLISDLRMSSRLDRIRLLNVIKTRRVKLVPDAEGGNYVVFEKSS